MLRIYTNPLQVVKEITEGGTPPELKFIKPIYQGPKQDDVLDRFLRSIGGPDTIRKIALIMVRFEVTTSRGVTRSWERLGYAGILTYDPDTISDQRNNISDEYLSKAFVIKGSDGKPQAVRVSGTFIGYKVGFRKSANGSTDYATSAVASYVLNKAMRLYQNGNLSAMDCLMLAIHMYQRGTDVSVPYNGHKTVSRLTGINMEQTVRNAMAIYKATQGKKGENFKARY